MDTLSLTKEARIYNGEKTISLTSGAGKTGQPLVKEWSESESEVTQLSLTLGDPMDCSLPDSSVHGIFQARVLEWGAIAFSEYNMQDS